MGLLCSPAFHMEQNFLDLVQRVIVKGCKTCKTMTYTLPQPIAKNISDYLKIFGRLAYDLDTYSIIKIDTDDIALQSRLGTVDITIRFKNKEDQNLPHLFEVQLAAYLSEQLNVKVIV